MINEENIKQAHEFEKNEFKENDKLFSELAEKVLTVDLINLENISSIDLSIALSCEFEKYVNLCIQKPRSCDVLKKRLGMISVDKNTLEAIGEHYEVSRERIRQIIEKSYKRLFASNFRCRGVFLKFIKEIVLNVDEKVLLHTLFVDFVELYGIHYMKAITICLFDKKYSQSIIDMYNEYMDIAKQRQFEYAKEKKLQQRKFNEAEDLRKKFLFPGDKKKFKASIKNKPFVRNINDEREGSGYVYLNKAGKKVPYESGAQYKVLLYLDNNDYIAEINAQCISIHYELNGEPKVCYPNIVVKTIDDDICLIEVKTFYHMALYNNVLKFRVLHKYCKENGLGYTVIDDRQRTIFDHKTCAYNQKLANKILEFYNYYGEIDYMQYMKLCREFDNDIGMTEFASLILNNHLKWSLNPFVISFENKNNISLKLLDNKKQN